MTCDEYKKDKTTYSLKDAKKEFGLWFIQLKSLKVFRQSK